MLKTLSKAYYSLTVLWIKPLRRVSPDFKEWGVREEGVYEALRRMSKSP